MYPPLNLQLLPLTLLESLFTTIPINSALCFFWTETSCILLLIFWNSRTQIPYSCMSMSNFFIPKYFSQAIWRFIHGHFLITHTRRFLYVFFNAPFTIFSFPLFIRYIDETFTVNYNSFYNIYNILNIMNSTNSNIQLICVSKSNGFLPFLDMFVTRTVTGFSTSFYRNSFTISFPIHVRSSNHPSEKKWPPFIIL